MSDLQTGGCDHDADGESETTPLLTSHDVVISKIPGCLGTRHILVVLGFLGFFNVYMMRVNLSVAMIAMVDYTPHQNLTPIVHNECPGELNSTKPHKSTAQTFDWDEDIQNQILSAFFYGYILTHVVGGWFAGRFGGKWVFGVGILCTSVLTLLTPLAASAGVGWFITLRILEGVGEGVTFPAMYAIMAHWAPPLERTRMLTFTNSGATFGLIVANPIAGLLCESGFLGGWPSAFYLSGALGILWFIFWAFLVHDTPAKHPRISIEERDYIERSIGPKQMTTLHIPVISIMTSVPVWAIIISTFGIAWGSYTLLTNLPNYLKNILKFDVSESGFLSSVPSILAWISTLLAGIAADYVRKKGLSTVATRKLFNSVGAIIQAVAIAMVGYVGCNQILAVLFFCVANIGLGLVRSGCAVNHLDIAPKYAGLLFGISNTAGTAAGFLAPTIVGVLTVDNNTREQWQIVFWICCGFFCLALVTYLLMASGEEQQWAKNDAYQRITNASDYNTSQYIAEPDGSINPDTAPQCAR